MKLKFKPGKPSGWTWVRMNQTKAYDSWVGFNYAGAMAWLRENVR